MKRCEKYFISAVILLAVLLFAVPISAASKTAKLTVKAGQIYYVKDSNISGNAISANKFKVTPKTSATKYDIVYVAKDSNGLIRERCFTNYGKTIISQTINGYIKSSSGANSGILLGIRVRSGSVLLQVASSRASDTFVLKLITSTKAPLVGRAVRKNREVKFTMTAGNTKYLPVIFGGTSGTQIKRPLSSTKYEVYTFLSSALRCQTYTNGSVSSTKTYSYNSSYSLSQKSYRCVLIYLPVGSSRSSGWLQTIKGYACYQYPRSYLGIKYTLKDI